MGCNAVRTSHNMPTPEWVEACDRMGMMMMCETRQMSSNAEGMAQLETDGEALSQLAVDHPLVRLATRNGRCRTEWRNRARRLPPAMVRLCHELDPTRVVSAAVNGDNEKGLSVPLDIIGFNYNLKMPEAFHQEVSQEADLWIGNVERHQHARRLYHRSRCGTR